MLGKCDMSCKERLDAVLKIVFIAVFTWGVMNAVCCMKSCNAGSASGCSKQATCSKAAVDTVK